SSGAGEDELLFQSDKDKFLEDWSRDGRFLLFRSLNGRVGYDLWVLPMDTPGEREPAPYLRSEFGVQTRSARFSPDSRWIAYDSTESGNYDVYVRPFPAPANGGRKLMVSQGGGGYPRWGADGKELFYLGLDGELMAVEISVNGAAIQNGIPKPLF